MATLRSRIANAYDGSTYALASDDIIYVGDTSALYDRPCPVSILQTYLEVGLSLDAARITGGTLDIARLPTGTTSTTVAIGDHTHTFASLTSKPTTLSGYGITDAIVSSTTLNVDTVNSRTGVGTATPAHKLHVYTTVTADGIAVDGTSAPAFIVKSSGSTRGFLPACATAATQFFTDAQTNDLIFRSEGGSILIGVVGTGQYSTLVVDHRAVAINSSSAAGALHVVGITASNVVGIFQGAASQSVEILRILNSAGTYLTGFTQLGGWKPASMSDSSATNDTVYYSTTASKLVYKDIGGTVNNLY